MTDRIQVTCPDCRAHLAVPETVAGRKIRCPKCQGVIAVDAPAARPARSPAAPAPTPRLPRSNVSSEKRSEVRQPERPAKSQRTAPDGSSGKRRRPERSPVEDPFVDDAEGSGGQWSSGYENPWNSYDDPAVEEEIPARLPPRAKKNAPARKKPALKGTGNEPPPMETRESQRSWGTVFSGILMMAGAVIWFFGGLAFGILFYYYPPVLFIVGLITAIKGLFGSE